MKTTPSKNLFLLVLAFALAVDLARAGSLTLLTGGPDDSPVADSHAFAPTFSADGRFVVFVSRSHQLVTNELTGPTLNVFVRDLLTWKVSLVSVSTNGFSGANEDANYPSISGEGRFVAFASAASNLVGNDTNLASDIFVRDLVAGTTILANVGLDGNVPRLGSTSANPLISRDGRWVVFESTAVNLETNFAAAFANVSGNYYWNVFARDLVSGQTAWININRPEAALLLYQIRANLASITPDGARVAFLSGGGTCLSKAPTRAAWKSMSGTWPKAGRFGPAGA